MTTDPENKAAPTSGAAVSAPPERAGPGWKTTLLVCLLIALLGGGAIAVIYNTEPVAQRVAATRQTAMLVDVVEAQSGTYRPTVVATGTVRAAREVVLRPRVGGRVVAQADGFPPGGGVAAGETLVGFDDTDYRNALAANVARVILLARGGAGPTAVPQTQTKKAWDRPDRYNGLRQ